MLGKMRSKTALSGCDFIGSGLQELLHGRINGSSQALHIVDGHIALSAFHGADVGPMQAGLFSQVFLRNSQNFATAPQILTKHVADIALPGHEFRLDRMMSLRLQTLSSIR